MSSWRGSQQRGHFRQEQGQAQERRQEAEETARDRRQATEATQGAGRLGWSEGVTSILDSGQPLPSSTAASPCHPELYGLVAC